MTVEILPSIEKKLLGVFARQPIAGQAKTRLAQGTSPEFAHRVAQAFLEDSLDRFAEIDAERAIVFTPAAASDFFARLSPGRYETIPQADGDLGKRLQEFFDEAHRRLAGRVVVVGTDSPTLPTNFVTGAFQALESHDVVLGPACDGGYYLIGTGPKRLPLFDGIPWSTSRVLEETVDRVRLCGARLAMLAPWYDVDTADDWTAMRGHVLAMRHAGIDPGVPHVERLIKETV